ncbi:MAG: hypothetical protein HYZ42_03345, partial [Bacteroidetes bacterium]|nr:hypothetical protein [Bacteroidota bacterium]
MLKKILFSSLILYAANLFSQGAVYINKAWQDAAGSPVFNPILNPLGVQWSNSIIGNSGGIITVGHSTVVGQGENIYLTKYDLDGNVIFQVNQNTSGANNDYGVALVEDPNTNDIIICGTTDNGTTTNYDIVIMRFDQNGSLLNTATFAGSAGLNDIATCLKLDTNGNVYIAASSEGTTSSYDYLLLKYSNNLTLIFNNTYDFASLIDTPIGIELGAGTDVIVTGASQSTLINWDYAVARFNRNTGAYISDVRNNIPGTGNDLALAFKKDASNNIYFTGKTLSGTNYNIKTVKINSSYSVVWTATVDINGLDDVANTIDVDAGGNVFIGGFATNSSNLKDLICIKYNPSGIEQWRYSQPSSNPTGNAYIQKLCV